MKRARLVQHLRAHGCRFEREGAKHSIWINAETGDKAPVPRHRDLPFRTAVSICGQLQIPDPIGDK